jgi:hypothetical protein
MLLENDLIFVRKKFLEARWAYSSRLTQQFPRFKVTRPPFIVDVFALLCYAMRKTFLRARLLFVLASLGPMHRNSPFFLKNNKVSAGRRHAAYSTSQTDSQSLSLSARYL